MIMNFNKHIDRSTIMFYSKSKHVYPGTGASEYLTEKDKQDNIFDELNSYQDFRKKMSNFYELENGLYCHGYHWLTVEHCFQGRKFETISPEYSLQFTLESGSELSLANGSFARKAGSKKQFPLNENQLQNWNQRKTEVMKEALFAKYTQFPDMKAILLATHDAQLLHRPPRGKLIVEYTLMEIREQIRHQEF